MEKIIVYVARGNQEYEVIKANSLKEGHEIFAQEFKKGNFKYLELGIDRIDVDGTYKIVRKINIG